MKSLQQYIVFVFAVTLTFWPAEAIGGTNFETCLAAVQNGLYGVGLDVGGTDSHGHPVNVSVAVGITYDLCIRACGTNQGPFDWTLFSQQFGAWVLPWLALVSQLPFGANDKLDNLESMLLTVGSPTLAAYSLSITVLNSRWITRHFKGYTYPNVRNAVRILNDLQQSPLRIVTEGGLLASLVVLPENDEWWSELIDRIDSPHTWSISSATSVGWVIVAYGVTLIDAFKSGGITSWISANGIGPLWLWLLPIVIGWLQVSPKCNSTRLRSAVERTNRIAYVANEDGTVVLMNEKSEVRAVEVTMRVIKEYELHRDEKCTAPIYNYARFLPWVQAVEEVSAAFKAASKNYHDHISVDHSIHWAVVTPGAKPDPRNRVGTTTEVEIYCGQHRDSIVQSRSRWGPQVFSRMFFASVLALWLQWSTAGGATIIVWFMPTQGLSCQSTSYLIYGTLSTLVWMLLVTSSVLTHYVTTTPLRLASHWSTRVAARFSIAFRCLGKVIATFNTIWIVLLCLFQLGGFFDRCYCDSSVFWLRDHAYNVITWAAEDITVIRNAWIAGTCLASSIAIMYIAFVNLYINSPLPH